MTSTHRPLRLLLTLLSALLLIAVAAGCGLKPGVAVETTGRGSGSGSGFDAGGEGGVGGDLAGGTEAGVAGDVGAAGGAEGGAAAGGAGGAAGAPGVGGQAAGGGGAAGGAAGPGDRRGIDPAAKIIRIGIHAPVTGAAPFPQSTFENGRKVYWDFVKSKGGFSGGWNVEVFFEDDEFKPSVAIQKCKKMVEQDKVFLLVGGGGAEQITACAKYANSVGVPYVSAGVNETGLTDLKTYFALSMSYSQQSPLLAQVAKNVLGAQPVAVVAADSAGFDDAFASVNREMNANGMKPVLSRRIPNSISQSQALQLSGDLERSGAKTVYFLASPTGFINVATAGQSQGYVPRYIGPGITSGLNTVARLGCPGIGQANFLSPFPQLDVIDRLDPDYRPAYRQYAGAEPDDIGIALWGLNKTLRVMFEATDPNTMSRQSFMSTLEGGKEFATNVFPPVKYGPGRHLGASVSHRLQADCDSRTYLTVSTFAGSF